MSALLEKAQKGWQETGQQLRAANARIVLALSILQHRSFCADCKPHVEHARMALLGKSIDEIREADSDATSVASLVPGVRRDVPGPEDPPAEPGAAMGVGGGDGRGPGLAGAGPFAYRAGSSHDHG